MVGTEALNQAIPTWDTIVTLNISLTATMATINHIVMGFPILDYTATRVVTATLTAAVTTVSFDQMIISIHPCQDPPTQGKG
jgi:hypothetical protein